MLQEEISKSFSQIVIKQSSLVGKECLCSRKERIQLFQAEYFFRQNIAFLEFGG